MKRAPRTHHYSPEHRPTVSRLARVVSIRKRNQMKPFYCPPLKCNIKIPSAALQLIIFGALQYLATALTAFTISGLLNKAIHKRDPINSRRTRPIVGSSTSNYQSLQVVDKGMLPPQFTSNFSPNCSVYVCCEIFSLNASRRRG